MILHGIAASEAIDSSGEKINLKGLDISTFQDGKGFANYEHKSGITSSALDIIGKVIYAKKIFSEKDCENEAQLFFWNKVQLPFLFVRVRLFDDAGHEGAKAVAAIIADAKRNKEPIKLGFSIEGAITKRDPKDNKSILSSLANQVAVTIKPCNVSAVFDVEDSDIKKSQQVSGYQNSFQAEELEKAFPQDEEVDALKGKIIESILTYQSGDPLEKHFAGVLSELTTEELKIVILSMGQKNNEELQELTKKLEICININEVPDEKQEKVDCYIISDQDGEYKIECQDGTFLHDGQPLDPESVATMLQDPSVKVKKMQNDKMAKSEEPVKQLPKEPVGEPKPHEAQAPKPPSAPGEKVPSLEHALNHVRDAVKAGHLHPDVAHMITQHLYAHPLVNTVGNKKAYEDFMARKPSGGAWVHMDGASFGQINKEFGHGAGDEAIKHMGNSVRAAADHVAPKQARAWMPGGDEAVVHLPSVEHAKAFVAKLHEHLDSHPPVGGSHKIAMNMGIGETPQGAELALISAKKEKKAINAPLHSQTNNAHMHDGSSSIKKIL